MSTTFDVFLSFRGLDTRRSFISLELVRRNIPTFKDDKELGSGRRISPELIRAIEESKFAVVVISANYAASTWCLEELVKIMDFENKGSLKVVPIFYGVDPCHVRGQIGDVAVQFRKHEDFNCFGPGSIVIITTQGKQLLISFNIKLVYEVELLRLREFFRQEAFSKRGISAAFESVMCRATNLAMEWLGYRRVRSG